MREQDDSLGKAARYIFFSIMEFFGVMVLLNTLFGMISAPSDTSVLLGFGGLALLISALVYQVVWLFSGNKQIKQYSESNSPRLLETEEEKQSLKL